MAENGKPRSTTDDPAAPASEGPRPVVRPLEVHDDHDDRIGFSSAAALAGRVRRVEPAPRPVAVEPDLPAWARETPATVSPATPVKRTGQPDAQPFGRRDEPMPVTEGALGLYAVYAMILFAVPTFGASAMLGLLAVIRRAPPEQEPARSHFIYQKRTLFAAGITAAIGAVLILVNLGVFVLFAVVIWIVVRGAVGVFRLKAGQPIPRPLNWWI